NEHRDHGARRYRAVESHLETVADVSLRQSTRPDARDERPLYLASLQEPSAFEYRRHRLFDSRHPCRRLLGGGKVVQVTPLPPRRQRLKGALETRVASE